VIRADDEREARLAAERALQIAAASCASVELLVESFVVGHELAIEGHLRQGQFFPLAVFDKPEPLDGPYFEESIYVTPPPFEAPVLEELTRLTASACRAIGLSEGPVHAEARRRDNGEMVFLELAARTIGGRCSAALTFRGELHLEDVVLADALGDHHRHYELIDGAQGVLMLPTPRRGRLVGVGGRDEVMAWTQIHGVEITVPYGQQVTPLPEGDRYLGFVFAAAPTSAEVVETLQRARRALSIEIAVDEEMALRQ
jgi:hypothetical protein